MKLRNIFLVFVLGTIWGFSSCSSEDIIDTPQNGEATLSISLSVNDIQTKAGEQIATPEELQISNCHIAVFDNEEGNTNGKFITSFDFSTGNGLSGDNNQYTCAAQKIRTFGNARKVKFLAIANIDGAVNKLDDVSGKSYSEYLNAVVASSSFNSTNLVKVGEKSIKLEKDESYSVQIDLTQLTARFDFDGITGNSSGTTVSDVSYEFEFLNKNEIEQNGLKSIMKNHYKDGVWDDDYFFYEKNIWKTGNRVAGIKITRTQRQSSGLQFRDKKVSGLNEQSIIGAYNDINTSLLLLNGEVPFEKTFYTYENTKSLKVTVVGSKSTVSTDVFYGFIEQEYEYDWGGGYTPKKNDLKEDNIVYNNEGKSCSVKNIAKWISQQIPSDGKGEDFTLDLSNIQFENGKRYIIKGTYNPTVSAKIDWVVLDWSSNENINIGFN